MRAEYDIRIADDRGRRLASIGRAWNAFSATRVVGGVGSLTLTLPYSATVADLLRRDYLISVSRAFPGGSPTLLFDQSYLIIAPRLVETNNTRLIEISAVDGNDLLRRRVIPYYAGSAETQVSGPADDSMKALVRENMGASASDYAGDTTRALPAGVFTVEGDLSLGPAVTASYAWRRLLDALRALAEAARENGTYLAFDVVATPGQPFQFRTFIGQRGIDRRGGMLPLSSATGTLRDVTLTMDYGDEVTAAYAGGRGEESDRIVQTAVDATRASASVWGRIEDFVQSQATTTAAALADAEARLGAGRPRTEIAAAYVDGGTTLFGRDLNYGDLVPCEAFGRQFAARLDTVTLAVAQDGLETIDIALRNEEELSA